MSLVARRAKNHPQQLRGRGADLDVDDRATTLDIFEPLDRRFGGFTVDVAAAAHNTKCERYYTIADDGLAQSWAGERVWCNPPYSNIGPWVQKAWLERKAELVVMLLPANRTEQVWWQRWVEPYRDCVASPLHSQFIGGRIRFLARGQDRIQPDERPPFGCVLLVWDRRKPWTMEPAELAPTLFDRDFGVEADPGATAEETQEPGSGESAEGQS